MLNAVIELARPGFTFSIAFEQRGRTLGAFGPSGAGKSTLLAVIAGLVKPDRGRIELDGVVLLDTQTGIDIPPHRRRIGFMFQDDRLFPHRDVAGNLRYGMKRSSATADRLLEFDSVSDLLGLRALLDRRIDNLSGGERQRIALGRALLSRPRLLLLDEPLSSLDARMKQHILPYLQRVRDALGVPMLYVSHDLAEILQLTDELLVLDRGRLAGHGVYPAIMASPSVVNVLPERNLVNLLHAVVVEHDVARGNTMLKVGDTLTLATPLRESLPVQSHVCIAIDPHDVSLAAHKVEGVSIRNQVQGRIQRITPHDGQALVEVSIGLDILVEVSPHSVQSMQLKHGLPIWCLIKSNAVRYV